MKDLPQWVSVVLFLWSLFFVMKMIGEVFFILVWRVSIDYFEASYANPFCGVLDGMIFNELVNKVKINSGVVK